MDSAKKRLTINTTVLTIKAIVALIVSLFSSRIVLNALGVDDFGLYNVIGSVAGIMVVLNGGMASSTQRFLTFALGKNDLQQLRKVYNVSLVIHIGVAILVLVVGEVLWFLFLGRYLKIDPSRHTEALWVFQFTLTTVVANILSIPDQAMFIAYERLAFFAVLEFLRTFVKLLGALFLLTKPSNMLVAYALFICLGDVGVRIVYKAFCSISFKENVSFLWVREKQLYKQIGAFAWWNIFGTIANVLKSHGTNVVVNFFFYPAINAAYAIALQINGGISQFSTFLMTASRPQIIKNYAQNKIEEMFNLAKKSIKICFFIQMALSVPFFLEIDEVLNLWLRKESVPEYAAAFAIMMLINMAIDINSYPLMAIVGATGRNRLYQTVVGGTLILNVPLLCLVLYFHRNPINIMLVNIVVSIIATLLRLILVKRLVRYSIRKFVYEVVVRLILASFALAPVFIMDRILTASTQVRFVLNCTLSPCIVAFLMFFMLFTKEERSVFFDVSKRTYVRLLKKSVG